MDRNDQPVRLKTPPIFNVPAIVSGIITACFLVFLVVRFFPQNISAIIFFKLAYIPVRYTESGAIFIDPVATIISPLGYTLLHADWIHLFVNMGMFLAFGSAIARRIETSKFLFLYCLGALGGVGISTLFNPQSITLMIGASAAISAMVGAISILAFVPRLGEMPPRPFDNKQTAVTFIVVWLGMNIITAMLPGMLFNVAGRIAWEAHIGGFIVGVIAIRFLLPKRIDG